MGVLIYPSVSLDPGSGSVNVLLAASVAGVSVMAYELEPPARPAMTIASCVEAASDRIAFAALKVCAAVNVWANPKPAIVWLVPGKVIVVASVPARVRLLFAVRVLPFAMVKVADVAGAVIATLLMLVAVATPIMGVTSVGDVANTSAPLPVSPVTAAARFVDEGVPSQVATPAPKDVIPVPPFPTGKVPVIAAV
jgi:hypothetical protein